MGEESPKPASTPTGAVFLSYASQDAEAAARICDALRSAGIEVWFDQSELRGGDAWDWQIRERIHDCRLFIALISAHTEARDEGYFRREWKLAVDRTHDMLEKKAFLLPVVIDGTPERGAAVPEKFHELQWTRLPGGATPPAFVERIKRLLSPEPPTTTGSLTDAAPGSSPIPMTTGRPSPWRRALPVAVAVLVVAVLASGLISKPWISKLAGNSPTSNATFSPTAPAAFAPPPHSIAVLPFVNMSGDKEQEYFSDGLSEELLNSLARINELQVAARTSSFYFKGEHTDLGTIAHKLNVASILEGSVRRSGQKIRITAQLNNAVTGFHLWSQTYDRDLSDVLKLQTQIATAVATALRVTLLGDEAAKIEVGGTRDPAAFDAYLRASKTYFGVHTKEGVEAAVAGYTAAIGLDPNYALAYAARSLAHYAFAFNFATTESAIRMNLDKALADAHRAVDLAADLGESHLALGQAYVGLLEFAQASEEFERALTLAPGNEPILREYGVFCARMGHGGPALSALHRAVRLDPLSPRSHYSLGYSLLFLRRYNDSIAAFKDYQALNPEDSFARGFIGTNYYLLGDLQRARSYCENDDFISQRCLAVTYDKLGRHADAEAVVAQMHASSSGGSRPVINSGIYAQWGNTDQALKLLETAMRSRDPQLEAVKSQPLLDPLRKEPRFQAIERELKFPN